MNFFNLFQNFLSIKSFTFFFHFHNFKLFFPLFNFCIQQWEVLFTFFFVKVCPCRRIRFPFQSTLLIFHLNFVISGHLFLPFSYFQYLFIFFRVIGNRELKEADNIWSIQIIWKIQVQNVLKKFSHEKQLIIEKLTHSTKSQRSECSPSYPIPSSQLPVQLHVGFVSMLRSNQFVDGIQSSNNPSNNYQLKMNHIYKDKLKSGLTEFQNRKLNLQTQYTHNQKQYRENINGVLGYIEKEDKRHNEEMITRLKKQEQRYRTFIDEDKVKNRRAVSLINKQYDPKVFFYQSEKQDGRRQTMEKDMWKKNKQLSCKKQEKENYIKKMKEQDQNLRRSQEQFLKTQAFKQATFLKKEQKNYQKNLIKMIEEKNTKKPRLQLTFKPHRHNPITNPIEYHIQNPYFLREMKKNKM